MMVFIAIAVALAIAIAMVIAGSGFLAVPSIFQPPTATPLPTPATTPLPTPATTPLPTPATTPLPTPATTPLPTPSTTPPPTPWSKSCAGTDWNTNCDTKGNCKAAGGVTCQSRLSYLQVDGTSCEKALDMVKGECHACTACLVKDCETPKSDPPVEPPYSPAPASIAPLSCDGTDWDTHCPSSPMGDGGTCLSHLSSLRGNGTSCEKALASVKGGCRACSVCTAKDCSSKDAPAKTNTNSCAGTDWNSHCLAQDGGTCESHLTYLLREGTPCEVALAQLREECAQCSGCTASDCVSPSAHPEAYSSCDVVLPYPGGDADDSALETVHLLNYNLWAHVNCGNDAKLLQMKGFVGKGNYDFLCFQEASCGGLFNQLLTLGFAAVDPGGDSTMFYRRKWWTVVANCRIPMTYNDLKCGGDGARDALLVVFRSLKTGHFCAVATVHLCVCWPCGSVTTCCESEQYQSHHRDIVNIGEGMKKMVRSVAEIADAAPTSVPIVVVGDMNLTVLEKRTTAQKAVDDLDMVVLENNALHDANFDYAFRSRTGFKSEPLLELVDVSPGWSDHRGLEIVWSM
jgi:hypothetical protein